MIPWYHRFNEWLPLVDARGTAGTGNINQPFEELTYMQSIQTDLDETQYLSLGEISMEADPMEDYYRFILIPFVDEILSNYGNSISLDSLPTATIIEFTEHYYKARNCVSPALLQALLEDREQELLEDRLSENNLKIRRYSDNGEAYISRF